MGFGDGFVDVGDGRHYRWGGSAAEPGGVGLVGGVEGDAAGGVDGGMGAEVDRGGGVPADAGMAVVLWGSGQEPMQISRVCAGPAAVG